MVGHELRALLLGLAKTKMSYYIDIFMWSVKVGGLTLDVRNGKDLHSLFQDTLSSSPIIT